MANIFTEGPSAATCLSATPNPISEMGINLESYRTGQMTVEQSNPSVGSFVEAIDSQVQGTRISL